MNNLMNPL